MIPKPANTTCDIYRNGSAPPTAPDVSAVPCFLSPSYETRLEHGEQASAGLCFTHTMLVDIGTDVRDYKATAFTVGTTPDFVYIPDQNGTPFKVVHVEVRNYSLTSEHKRIYLDRGTPTWPTNDL